MLVLVLIILISPLILIWWYQNFSRFFTLLNKIPGPPGYPVIGNASIFRIHGQDFQNDREIAQKYYPLYKTWSLFYAGVTLLHPDDIELVLSSRRHINKSMLYTFLHPWLGTGLLTSGGTKWQTRRKMLTPVFHFDNIRNFLGIFVEETEKLLEDFKYHKGGTADIQNPISQFTLSTILRTAIGVDLDVGSIESRNYKKAVEAFTHAFLYRVLRPWFFSDTTFFNMSKVGKMTKKSIETLHDFSKSVIIRKQEHGTKKHAMLDILLAAKTQGCGIDDDGIREELDTFIFEGHDTTSACLCYTLFLLAKHKQVQDEVFDEIKDVLGYPIKIPTYNDLKQLPLMERCIKESLRLYPSIPWISRTLTEDLITTTGYTIPKGADVYVSLCRNPEIYPDPEKFDPDRFLVENMRNRHAFAYLPFSAGPRNCIGQKYRFLVENMRNRHAFAYLPFSAGPRNCIGQKYAILEIKMALCGILGSFVLEADDGPRDLVLMKDIVLRCKGGVKVRFRPRDEA